MPEVTGDMLSEMALGPAPGKYRHYKGGLYEVYGTARHSETGEVVVVYRPLYGERELWVRPRQMFLEYVEIDGEKILRFERVSDDMESSL